MAALGPCENSMRRKRSLLSGRWLEIWLYSQQRKIFEEEWLVGAKMRRCVYRALVKLQEPVLELIPDVWWSEGYYEILG